VAVAAPARSALEEPLMLLNSVKTFYFSWILRVKAGSLHHEGIF
jgi:hypothetical protein